MEEFKPFGPFGSADELDSLARDGLEGQGGSASGIGVELAQDDA